MDDLLLEQSAVGQQQASGKRLMYTTQEKRINQQAKKAALMAQKTQEKLMSLITGRGAKPANKDAGSGSTTPSDSWIEQQDPNLPRKHLATHSPKGVYIMPSERDERIWNGVIFIAEGPYANGVFRFTITLPDDYPDAAPGLQFTSYVWHPQVDPETGSMTSYLHRHFPQWDGQLHRLSDAMKVVAMAFYNIDTANPANHQAAEMCIADAKLWEYRVAECIQESHAETFDHQEGSSVIFRPYDPSTHDKVREKMLKQEFEGFGSDLIDASVKIVSNLASAATNLFKD